MVTTVPSNLVSLMQIASKVDAEVRWRCFWEMTPAAFVTVCMFPSGRGKFLGDEMLIKKERPRLWGNDVEIIRPMRANECRFALVDPFANEPKWQEFRETPPHNHLPFCATELIEAVTIFTGLATELEAE